MLENLLPYRNYSPVSLRGGFPCTERRTVCRSNLVFSCNRLFAGWVGLLRRLGNGFSQPSTCGTGQV